jgi:hypothetical protein
MAQGPEGTAPSNPLPTLDFWKALEAGEYGRAWDEAASYFQRDQDRNAWVAWMEQSRRPYGMAVSRTILSALFLAPAITEFPLRRSPLVVGLAVSALLLLTASGNAVVMFVGSARLLIVGLVWYGRRAWRSALLAGLASLGVATAAVVFLVRDGLPSFKPQQPTASLAVDAAWVEEGRLEQVIGLGGHGAASQGDAIFRYEILFDERSVALTVSYRREKDASYRVQLEDRGGRRRELAEGGLASSSRFEEGYEVVQHKNVLNRAEFERLGALILQGRKAEPGTTKR